MDGEMITNTIYSVMNKALGAAILFSIHKRFVFYSATSPRRRSA